MGPGSRFACPGRRVSVRHTPAFSRHECVRVLEATHPRKQRGRRECRVMASPMARLQQKKQAAVTTGGAGQPAFPARWFTAYIAISPGTGLSCPRRLRDDLANLSLSVGRPGPRDFTVRVSHVRLTCPPRPSHPRPTYRDDRPKRPSSSRRDAREHGFDLPDAASEDACGRLARRAVRAWGVCDDRVLNCTSAARPSYRSVQAAIVRFVVAASSSSIGSRSPAAADARMLLAITERLARVRIVAGNDAKA